MCRRRSSIVSIRSWASRAATVVPTPPRTVTGSSGRRTTVDVGLEGRFGCAERSRVRADRAKWRLVWPEQRRDCLQPLGCALELLLPARNRARPVRVELAIDRSNHLDCLLRWRQGFKSLYRLANAVEVAAGCAGPPFGAHQERAPARQAIPSRIDQLAYVSAWP